MLNLSFHYWWILAAQIICGSFLVLSASTTTTKTRGLTSTTENFSTTTISLQSTTTKSSTSAMKLTTDGASNGSLLMTSNDTTLFLNSSTMKSSTSATKLTTVGASSTSLHLTSDMTTENFTHAATTSASSVRSSEAWTGNSSTSTNSTMSSSATTNTGSTTTEITTSTSPAVSMDYVNVTTTSMNPVTSMEHLDITTTQSTVSSTPSTFSSSPTTSESTSKGSAPSKPGIDWIAAPIILGSLLIVAVVVLLILRSRRRKRAKDLKYLNLNGLGDGNNGGVMNPTFKLDPEDNERPPPPPVRVDDFVNHVGNLHRDSDYGFASEFSLLGKLSQQHPKTAAELPENRTKNRFTNVLPFDHSRVRLTTMDDDEGGGSDYINASFMPGFSSRREFIAAQGPMRSTIDDFWRMIWEYNVTTIVMVTNMFERGREKCSQYWPELNDPIFYGDVQVELTSESSLNYYVIRILSVKMDQQVRRVMQFQFLTWPDFGVPKEHDHLLSFLTQVRNSIPFGNSHPVLVHCSAGVGRTGTFIIIDHVLQMIKQNPEIDVFSLVLDMRNSRPCMIQTEAQYIFAHECIRYAIDNGYLQGRVDFAHASADEATTDDPAEDSSYVNAGEKKM